MQIGGKPGESVFQARQGGDTFLVLDIEGRMLHLYQTVETLLCPSIQGFEDYHNQPYYWAEATGLMYVLKEVSTGNWAHVEDIDDARDVLQGMEAFVQSL